MKRDSSGSTERPARSSSSTRPESGERTFRLAAEPIDVEAYKAPLRTVSAGALSTFEGWVRDSNEGRRVLSLEYSAYHALALREGARVMAEAIETFGLLDAFCVHRVGHLSLGDCAVWVAALSGHREAAFQGCRFIIDEIKVRVPIWKREHYADGTSAWVLPGAGAAAR